MDTPNSTLLTPSRPTDLTIPELLLAIRFSASIPDVQLEIASPFTTTAAGLKQLIRARLPPDLFDHRLRLIYSGRGLEDAVPLSTSLKLPPPSSSRTSPTPSTNDSIDDDEKGNGKGKAPVRDPPLPRLYVHCSIGDITLSADDLAAEAALASTLQTDQSPTAAREKQRQQKEATHLAESMTTTAAPRGFDRLLSAGFTASEVSALRSQFLALQSVSHTPDTMPSGAELRELEDRWMDEGSEATGGGAGAAGGGAFAGGEDDRGSHGALDDMLWGAVMGFFWPIGCVMWLRREEGVWSWRKGLAVFVGVVVNVAFGAMRVMN